MNGTMPATVNSSDGSGEISEALGTTVCPRWAKCSRKRRRISAVCIGSTQFCGAGAGAGLLGGSAGGQWSAACAPRRPGSWIWSPVGSGASRPVPARSSASRSAAAARTSAPKSPIASARSRSPSAIEAPMPGGGHLLGGAGELAHDEGTDRDAHGEPEQAPHQEALRSARRARRASLSRAAASASGLALTLLLRRGAHPVAERGDLDQRAAQRGGDDAASGPRRCWRRWRRCR